MNLRKKLTIASILMILIPLFVSAFLCAMVVFYKGNSSLNRLKNLYENDNGYLDVQTILYSYADQILSYTPLEYEDGEDHENQGYSDDSDNARDGNDKDYYKEDDDREDDGWDDNDDDRDDDDDWDDDDGGDDDDDDRNDDDDWDDDDDDQDDDDDNDSHTTSGDRNNNRINQESADQAFGKLIKELETMRYYYQISYEDQVIVSNLPEYARDEIVSLAGPEYRTIRNFAVTDGEDSVVKRTYSDDTKTLDVIAYCDQYDSNSHLSQVIRDFVFLVFLFMAILTVAIVVSIIVLTKWLSAGMSSSLGQLSEAVRQVQDGNLSYRIRSQKKDELGKACQEFDEMAEYLENSVKEREMYEESRKQMLAGISHDLRTPLTSVKAYVEGLRDGIANTEEKRRRYYDALKIRTADLEALIDNLSLFSRFDRGEHEYSMERLDLGEFLVQFFKENAVELQENHITLESDIKTGEPFYINGDKMQLRRLLNNLIDNTLKYREKEETILKTILYRRNDKIILELEDDGPGVPLEDRELIFDTFYRGDKARSDPGSGSGLGLSIVKKILKKHGADIFAKEGRDGKGLRLIMEFPLEEEWTDEKASVGGGIDR